MDHQTTIHFKKDNWRLCDEMKPPSAEKDFISAGHCVFRKRHSAMHRLIILAHIGSWRENFQVPRQLSFPWQGPMWALISLHFKSLYIALFSVHGVSGQGHLFTYKHPKKKCCILFAQSGSSIDTQHASSSCHGGLSVPHFSDWELTPSQIYFLIKSNLIMSHFTDT